MNKNQLTLTWFPPWQFHDDSNHDKSFCASSTLSVLAWNVHSFCSETSEISTPFWLFYNWTRSARELNLMRLDSLLLFQHIKFGASFALEILVAISGAVLHNFQKSSSQSASALTWLLQFKLSGLFLESDQITIFSAVHPLKFLQFTKDQHIWDGKYLDQHFFDLLSQLIDLSPKYLKQAASSTSFQHTENERTRMHECNYKSRVYTQWYKSKPIKCLRSTQTKQLSWTCYLKQLSKLLEFAGSKLKVQLYDCCHYRPTLISHKLTWQALLTLFSHLIFPYIHRSSLCNLQACLRWHSRHYLHLHAYLVLQLTLWTPRFQSSIHLHKEPCISMILIYKKDSVFLVYLPKRYRIPIIILLLLLLLQPTCLCLHLR